MPDIWDKIKEVSIELPEDVLKKFVDSFNAKFTPKCEMKVYQRNKTFIESFSGSTDASYSNVQSEIYLRLEADFLNNYQLAILNVVYDITTVYPCNLSDNLNNINYKCNNPEEFRNYLKDVFSSDRFVSSASMILTQVEKKLQNSSF